MCGFDVEPTPRPEQVVDQMRKATERLRDRAWMVAPVTTPVGMSVIEAELERNS